MSITSDASVAGASREWTLLLDFWRRRPGPAATGGEDRRIAQALGQLSQFDDRELSDVGLCRSDLTPDGLAAAGARRRARQAAIDAAVPQRRQASPRADHHRLHPETST
jgi:hypothetical protein